jgi:hypothetical protein
MGRVFRLRPGCVAASVFVLLLAGTSVTAGAPVPLLFDPPTVGDVVMRGAVARWRPAVVRLDVLTQWDGSSRLRAGERIVLNLFDDAGFTATITDVDGYGAIGHTWSAALDGVDGGHAVLALHDGAVVGTVVMPGAVYRIGYAPDGTQVVEQVDTSVFPPEAEPIVPPPLAPDRDRAPDVAADSGAQIDVMVVYTAAARAVAGGTAAMQAEVTAAVASANQAYANNGLVQRLRLVFTGEVALTESGDISVDLDKIQTDATIASLRDTYGADLVSLLTDSGPGAVFCGIAFVLGVNSPAYAPYGFSVVERDCASANLSFAHELGHNMGAQHDLYVAGLNDGLFVYSHGYVDLVGKFRTIMAYPNQCSDAGFHCPRLMYFSSPNRTFNGRVIGDASTADNARTLNESANAVANFRQAVGGGATFADVPLGSPFGSWVEALVAAGITSGCATSPPLFCPDTAVTRGEMAVFLRKGMAYPGSAAPGSPTGTVFADVPKSHPYAAWIESLFAAGVTGGCATGPLRYCPDQPVTRAEMAVFLLRARHGAGYVPPAPAGQSFADVALNDPFASWIYRLAAEGITGGCATSPLRYCPAGLVTRAEMAVFLVRAFNLPH